MRHHSRVLVAVLACAACAAERGSIDSERPQALPRASVSSPRQQPMAAGNGAPQAVYASSPITPRTPQTRSSVRVGETQSVTISIDLLPPAAAADCTAITLTVVGASAVPVGERVALQAHSGELDSPEVRYVWSGPPELEPSQDTASFLCNAPGQYALTLRLVSPEACATELPFGITCQ